MPLSEDRFLTAGRNGKFSVKKWGAITGIGSFDADYSPQASLMDIKFNVNIDFRDTDIKWTDEAKLKWQNLCFKTVGDFWSGRYLFECNRKGWRKHLVNTRVRLVQSSEATAHVKLGVRQVSPDIGTMGGGVGWGTTPPSCNIDNLALFPKDQRKLREGIFNMRVVQLAKGLSERNLGVIPFEKNSAELSGPTKMKLLDYAKYVHRIATKDVKGIELVVFGSSGGDDRVLQTGLGRRRADAVAEVLNCVIRDDSMVVATGSSSKKPGLKQSILDALSTAKGKPVTSTNFQGACIVTHIPPGTDRAAEPNYIVLCHEFGHMLGLPDEYMGRLHPQLTQRSNMDSLISQTLQLAIKQGDPKTWTDDERRRADQQGGVAELLRYNPDVRSPTFLDQTQIIDNTQVASSSIMYAGMEVMPAHYLTIWSCLAEMTWDYLSPSDWKIRPSPVNRSAIRYF